MAVTIKSSQEIELMRQAGKILAKVHEGLKKELKPGMSTLDIDRIGEEMIRSFGCEPSFKNYQGYPASVCVSINEEVVHGIPRKDRIIEEGDIVTLRVSGNGFLYNMVRIIAGVLIKVGLEQKEPEEVREAVEHPMGKAAGPTAPAHGLTLVEIKYLSN